VIAAGVSVAAAAAVANAFALVLQAAEDRRAPLSQGGRISLLIGLAHRPRWVAGIALMVVAWPLQVVALALAPIAVVQPLLSTTQLVLLGVARLRLDEQVGRVEALGALAIVAGVATVVWAAPRHTIHHLGAGRLAAPLAVVGGLAVAAYVLGRLRPRAPISLVIGAGLAYAWVDFVNKLLANALSGGHIGFGIVWLAAILCFGALAFLEETTALQRRPAVTVAPVIGAIHDPLPVLMALWSGVAVWGSAPHRIAALVIGLAVIATGAAILGRSKAVAKISGGAEEPTVEAFGGCRRCSPNPSWMHRVRRDGGRVAVSVASDGRTNREPAVSLLEDG
jgi:drug/metabolite transporter (DMT)-like permease